MRTADHLVLIPRLAEALTRVINETPNGAPADRLYAGITDHCTREEFDALMRTLVLGERIAQRGERYYPVNHGGKP